MKRKMPPVLIVGAVLGSGLAFGSFTGLVLSQFMPGAILGMAIALCLCKVLDWGHLLALAIGLTAGLVIRFLVY